MIGRITLKKQFIGPDFPKVIDVYEIRNTKDGTIYIGKLVRKNGEVLTRVVKANCVEKFEVI